MIQRALIVALLLAASACGSSSSPPSAPAAPSAPPASTQFTLSGAVRDRVTLTPVSGAQVRVLDGTNKDRTATTDAAGNYTAANLSPGGFTIQITATDFTTLTQAVTLAADTALVISLVRLPAPFLVLADSTPANPQFVAYCVEFPCNTFGYRFSARNAGTGCAGSITGTLQLSDNNGLRVADVPFALPAGTVIRPAQNFLYEACCVSLQTQQSWRSFFVVWSSTTVAC